MDLRPHPFRDRSIDIDLLTLFYQPKAHLPCGLILHRIARICDGREHEMGADWDVARLKDFLGFLSGELNVFLYLTSEGRADVHQFGSVVFCRDLNAKSLHIVAGHLPELPVVLQGGMVQYPVQ